MLKSTLPPMMPLAWTSLSTGLSPARHGIYDSWDFAQLERTPHTTIVTHRKGGKAIWNYLSEWNKRVIIANVPLTYPPEPVNGIMLSGYATPDMSMDITYPTSFKEHLLAAIPEYQIDLDPMLPYGQRQGIATQILHMTAKRNAMLQLLLKETWDFFFIVYTGADRLQHLCWDEIMHFNPLHIAYYQQLDTALGMILDTLTSKDLLMIVSNHGFRGAQRKFYIQEYLYKQGFLKMKDASTRLRAESYGHVRTLIRLFRLQKIARHALHTFHRTRFIARKKETHLSHLHHLDLTSTRAWVPSPSGTLGGYADIYFDQRVSEQEIAALQADLCAIRDPRNGRPLVTSVYREDVYGSGPYALPERHLIIQNDEQITFPVELARITLWETCNSTRRHGLGVHHADGILYLYGAGTKKGISIAPAHIHDIVPTILAQMGLPLPADLEGQVLDEAFEQPLPSVHKTELAGMVKRKLKKLTNSKEGYRDESD